MITIRTAGPEDAGLILDFIIELAVYEKAPEQVVTSVAEIQDTLFGPGATAKALVCYVNDKPAGYAVYFYNFSTWLGKNGIYLEDVYVTPGCRGLGCGKALLKHLANIALDNNCGRFEWSVLDWNTPAIEFYEALGAKAQHEWISYRLTGEALQALAES